MQTTSFSNSSSFFSSGNSVSPSRQATRETSNIPVPNPPTSEPPPAPTGPAPAVPAASKDSNSSNSRRLTFTRKSSFSSSSRRRGSSAAGSQPHTIVTDAAAPPALPDYALSAAAKITPIDRERPITSAGTTPSIDIDAAWSSTTSPNDSFGGKSLSRSTTSASNTGPMYPAQGGHPNGGLGLLQPGQAGESGLLHQQITEIANKRISTLDYMRKSHEGRLYWFNTYLFDKPDLHKLPYFDHRKLARKATNLLLLGLSLPTISELYSSTPIEYLRSLSILLSEFESFQQLHSEHGSNRPRLQSMFRRQPGKARKSTAADTPAADDGSGQGAVTTTAVAGAASQNAHNVMNFAASESDLLPGEEYSYLLTPSLPFDPDYYETFATLCNTLIEAYSKFLSYVPTPKDCTVQVAELFSKVDAKVKKIVVQGVVKEFEEHSRAQVKTEAANIGRAVLGGLM